MRPFIGTGSLSNLGWLQAGLFTLALAGWMSATQTGAIAAESSIASNPESRQFDFWLGDWAITNANGSNEASSRVYLALGQYLVVESWDDGRNHKGENLFAYNADDKTWHGMFADNQGRVHVFTGNVSGGRAEFYGPSQGPSGEAVLNRIRVVRLATNKVEQSWEKSTDNGASWTVVFKGEYARKAVPK
jgi:hypothetical protein